MNSYVKKMLLMLVLSLSPIVAIGGLSDCENMYVGRIMVYQGSALYAVIFLESPTATSGSYWAFFDGWDAADKRAALAMLVAAKLAQHRVNATTTASGGCSVTAGTTNLTTLVLSTNP